MNCLIWSSKRGEILQQPNSEHCRVRLRGLRGGVFFGLTAAESDFGRLSIMCRHRKVDDDMQCMGLVDGDPAVEVFLKGLVCSALCTVTMSSALPVPGVLADESSQINALENIARRSYAERNFDQTMTALNAILESQPDNFRFLEMRADTLVDEKKFPEAILDYTRILNLTEGDGDALGRARVLASRALSYEGLDMFEEAASEYEASLALATSVGADEDPYIVNSLGNCYNSLGRWKKARECYLKSGNLFQTANSSMGKGGSLQKRLDGSIFAFSNAALMDAQLGEDDGAVIKRLRDLSRRAPGSSDMRIALAVMYWTTGQDDKAETEFEFACNSIAVGCAKYEDLDWLIKVRRWPPVMVQRMEDFLALRR